MTPEQVKASIKKKAKETKNSIIKPLYKQLLKNGWTLNQIDEMDIHFYLELSKPEKVYIDQIKLF
jgi:ribonucleotide reductase beta subunit family protein with ferritin-like domain